jgi:Tfp pilus assembly protein FimV
MARGRNTFLNALPSGVDLTGDSSSGSETTSSDEEDSHSEQDEDEEAAAPSGVSALACAAAAATVSEPLDDTNNADLPEVRHLGLHLQITITPHLLVQQSCRNA